MSDKMISMDTALDMAEAEWRAAQRQNIRERTLGFGIGIFTASALWALIIWITR